MFVITFVALTITFSKYYRHTQLHHILKIIFTDTLLVMVL